MKKIIAFTMVIALLFALAGCSSTDSNSSSADSNGETTAVASTAQSSKNDVSAADNTASGSKTLVVYFSRAGEQYGVGVIEKGNTAIVADMIAEQTGADTFEIKPKVDNYNVSYSELTDIARDEMNSNARPEIASAVENFDSYDTVYFGYPIWWGDLPMISYTFLESYDFSGKTIIPFCTHAGSGDAGTQSKIQSAVSDAEVKEVFAVAGTDAQNNQDSVKQQIIDWLD